MALPKVVKLTVAATILAVVAGSIIYLNKPESQSATQTTDDAYVQADFTFVAPQVSGTVDQVLIKDNQRVQKGDLIATIDNRDFVVALDSAKAQANSAKASVASLQAKLTYQDSLVQQAQAAVEADTASLKLAQLNLKRYTNLATDGSGTVQAREEAQAKLAIQKANLHKNQAGLAAAKQQIKILRADIEKAKAALVQAKARVVDAELKLSYTQITAPIDGIVGQKSVRVGAYVNPGSPLLVVVPLDKVFVSANYRETQLANVGSGKEDKEGNIAQEKKDLSPEDKKAFKQFLSTEDD
jgi:membrane fusion protein (multidrug efflux system)